MKTINYKNSLIKKKLKSKELTIGSWLTIPSTEVVEILSTAGFEWLVIDLEHTSITFHEVKYLVNTIQGNGMNAFVRVSKNNETEIKKVLDLGCDGIIVPMIKNKNEMQKAINSTLYPPYGIRGVGLSRAQKYGTSFQEYNEYHKNNIIVIAQIEHKKSVDNLSSILKCEGLDGIIVGPYDLSASLGFPGDYDNNLVKKYLIKIEQKLKKSKVSLGFHIIESDYKIALSRIKKGYNLIAFSIDFFFLGNMARDQMKNLTKNL